MSDLETDEQALATGILAPVADPGVGTALTVNSPIWLHGHDKVVPQPPPGLGEHSEAILLERGYGDADIRRMVDAGVVGPGGRFGRPPLLGLSSPRSQPPVLPPE